jgi:hypothetical protein
VSLGDRLIRLGEVTVSSGIVLIIDTGTLDAWSHNEPPPTQAMAHLAGAFGRPAGWSDFAITGSGALAAGTALGVRWPANAVDILYDVPSHEVDELHARFDAIVRAQRLDAKLEAYLTQIPHRQRVDRTLRAGNGAGVVFYGGMPAIAVADIPASVPMQVYGVRMRRRFTGCLAARRAVGRQGRRSVLGPRRRSTCPRDRGASAWR